MANSSQPPAIAPTLALAAVSPSFRLQSPSLNSIRLRRVFDLFDRNGDGEITVAELRLALERLGLAVDHEELASTVAAYVRPGRASLDFEDFEAFHRAVGDALVGGDGGVEEAEQVESDMREAFGVFDQNGDGFISAAELQAVLQKLGLFEGRSIDGVHRMISAVDRDFDGRVNFSEFKNMMRNIELSAS
ncbi:probable calcium-binding protein CML32 [Zingiber officinale]|uniref:probable calcium-binding protein CML32 n=1 Tax=Zingiber officinale TaxID=94328 RepID=UPI001C4D6C5E|nr:probable calcium-binding protein CML32 [Zingiber officinale]